VSITVIATNEPPAAQNNSYSTDEDTALVVAAPGVLSNDTDPDGNPLTAVLVAGPAHGSVTVNPNGGFSYTPAANYNGPDSFTYKANDGTADSNAASVSLTVNAVNDAPIATGDAFNTNEDASLAVSAPGVLANDADAIEGSALTAVLVAGPAHGTVTLSGDGSFTYVPAANYSGADSFTYKANDGSADSNIATVAVSIAPMPDAPVAENDSFATTEDTTLVMFGPAVLANDTDIDGHPLTAIVVTGPSNGTLTLNASGGFTYMPAVNYSGTDSFTYKANDGFSDSNVATVTIEVNAVNDVPVAGNNTYGTSEDVPLVVGVPGVLGNDSDADGNQLAVIVVSGPTRGTLLMDADGGFT
jgi:large repetitive protein